MHVTVVVSVESIARLSRRLAPYAAVATIRVHLPPHDRYRTSHVAQKNRSTGIQVGVFRDSLHYTQPVFFAYILYPLLTKAYPAYGLVFTVMLQATRILVNYLSDIICEKIGLNGFALLTVRIASNAAGVLVSVLIFSAHTNVWAFLITIAADMSHQTFSMLRMVSDTGTSSEVRRMLWTCRVQKQRRRQRRTKVSAHVSFQGREINMDVLCTKLTLASDMILVELVECIVPLIVIIFETAVILSGNSPYFVLFEEFPSLSEAVYWQLLNALFNCISVYFALNILKGQGFDAVQLVQALLAHRGFFLSVMFGISAPCVTIFGVYLVHHGAERTFSQLKTCASVLT